MIKSICSILILLMMSCAYGCTTLLKYEDIQFYKLRETQSEPIVSLEISGLAYHSSLAVEKIKTKTEDNSLVVLVYLTLARRGLSGSFTYNFDVPERVDSVTFGPDKRLIWMRGIGPMLLEYKDVQFLKVRETQSKQIVSLEISGIVLHSALAVEKVETKTEDKSLAVLIHLTPARPGIRSDFTYNFDVPERVDSVTFGPDKRLIWMRGLSPVK